MDNNSEYSGYSENSQNSSEYSDMEFEGYSSGSENNFNPKIVKQEIMAELSRLVDERFYLLKNDNNFFKDILLRKLLLNEQAINKLKYKEAGIDNSLLDAEIEFLGELKEYERTKNNNNNKNNFFKIENIKKSLDDIRKAYIPNDSKPLDSLEYSTDNGTLESMFDNYYSRELNSMKIIAKKEGISIPARKDFNTLEEYSQAESEFYTGMLNYSPKENNIFNTRNKRKKDVSDLLNNLRISKKIIKLDNNENNNIVIPNRKLTNLISDNQLLKKLQDYIINNTKNELEYLKKIDVILFIFEQYPLILYYFIQQKVSVSYLFNLENDIRVSNETESQLVSWKAPNNYEEKLFAIKLNEIINKINNDPNSKEHYLNELRFFKSCLRFFILFSVK